MPELLEIVLWVTMVLSLGILLYVYIGYYIVVFILGFFKKKHAVDENYTPTVSLVIPAYNEDKFIAEKLDNALSLDYPEDKLNIIVASDNSSDNTASIVNEYVSKYPQRITFHDFKIRRGKMGVLNTVVPFASTELMVFTDANAMYEVNAIKKLTKHFVDPAIGCVGGAKVIKDTSAQASKGEGVYWKLESFVKKQESKFGSCAGADGAIYAIRRELYNFPPDKKIIMDDFAVSLGIIANGFRCIYEPEAKAYEDASVNITDEFRRKGRILAGAINSIQWKKRLLLPTSPVFLQLWSHKILRWSSILFMIILLFSSIALSYNPYARILVALQGIFYLSAIMGFGYICHEKKPKLFYVPFYFCFFNLTQLFGYFTYLKEDKNPAWEKLER